MKNTIDEKRTNRCKFCKYAKNYTGWESFECTKDNSCIRAEYYNCPDFVDSKDTYFYEHNEN